MSDEDALRKGVDDWFNRLLRDALAEKTIYFDEGAGGGKKLFHSCGSPMVTKKGNFFRRARCPHCVFEIIAGRQN